MTVKSYDGWITETRTWTYASGTGTNVGTFTVAGVDLTAVYNVGDRVKFTQTTVKYGIITKVAFSTDTTVTIYMGTDYTIANAAISANAISHDRSPVGFPTDPSKWTITTTDTATNTQTSPVNGTWYNPGSTSITLPIGVWRTSYEAQLITVSNAAQTQLSGFSTLSTANNTESDAEFTAEAMLYGASGALRLGYTVRREKTLVITSSTPYYLNTRTGVGSQASVGFEGAVVTTKIRAICAYL